MSETKANEPAASTPTARRQRARQTVIVVLCCVGLLGAGYRTFRYFYAQTEAGRLAAQKRQYLAASRELAYSANSVTVWWSVRADCVYQLPGWPDLGGSRAPRLARQSERDPLRWRPAARLDIEAHVIAADGAPNLLPGTEQVRVLRANSADGPYLPERTVAIRRLVSPAIVTPKPRNPAADTAELEITAFVIDSAVAAGRKYWYQIEFLDGSGGVLAASAGVDVVVEAPPDAAARVVNDHCLLTWPTTPARRPEATCEIELDRGVVGRVPFAVGSFELPLSLSRLTAAYETLPTISIAVPTSRQTTRWRSDHGAYVVPVRGGIDRRGYALVRDDTQGEVTVVPSGVARYWPAAKLRPETAKIWFEPGRGGEDGACFELNLRWLLGSDVEDIALSRSTDPAGDDARAINLPATGDLGNGSASIPPGAGQQCFYTLTWRHRGRPEPESVTLAALPPPLPTGLSAQLSDNRVILNWDRLPADADGWAEPPEIVVYRVARQSYESGAFEANPHAGAVVHRGPASESACIDIDVSPGQEYGYVMAVEGVVWLDRWLSTAGKYRVAERVRVFSHAPQTREVYDSRFPRRSRYYRFVQSYLPVRIEPGGGAAAADETPLALAQSFGTLVTDAGRLTAAGSLDEAFDAWLSAASVLSRSMLPGQRFHRDQWDPDRARVKAAEVAILQDSLGQALKVMSEVTNHVRMLDFARFLLRRGLLEAAAEIVARVDDLSADDADILEALGQSDRALAIYLDALSQWQSQLAFDSSAYVGALRLCEGNVERSIKVYGLLIEQVLSARPYQRLLLIDRLAELRPELGQHLLRRRAETLVVCNRREAAARTYSQLMREYPGTRDALQARERLAALAREAGQFNVAEAHCRAALDEIGDDPALAPLKFRFDNQLNVLARRRPRAPAAEPTTPIDEDLAVMLRQGVGLRVGKRWYFQDDDGSVTCFDVERQVASWVFDSLCFTADAHDPQLARPYTRRSASRMRTHQPILIDAVLVLSTVSGGCVFGLDAESGVERWRHIELTGLSNPLAVDGTVIVATTTGRFLRLRPTDGEIIAAVDNPAGGWQIAANLPAIRRQDTRILYGDVRQAYRIHYLQQSDYWLDLRSFRVADKDAASAAPRSDLEVAADPAAPGRRRSIERLGVLANVAAVPVLLQILEESNDENRVAALTALGNIRDPTAVPALQRQLRRKSGPVRARAAWALTEMLERQRRIQMAWPEGRDLSSEMAAALLDAAGEHPDLLTGDVIRTCAALQPNKAAPLLRAAMASAGAEDRLLIAGALVRQGDLTYVDELIADFERPVDELTEDDVATAAALASQGRVEPVLYRLAHLSDEYQQGRLFAAIGSSECLDFMPTLMRLTRRELADKRRAYPGAAQALAALGDRRAVPALLLATEEPVFLNLPVYDALTALTGQGFGRDPAGWRVWGEQHAAEFSGLRGALPDYWISFATHVVYRAPPDPTARLTTDLARPETVISTWQPVVDSTPDFLSRTRPIANPADDDWVVVRGSGGSAVTTVSDDNVVTVRDDLGGHRLQFPSRPVAIAVGHGFGCAAVADGAVVSWGGNAHGQLGTGLEDSWQPAGVPGLDAIVAVAAGSEHALALTADGTVWAWGHNDYGQLGDGSTETRRQPVRLSAPREVIAIACGNDCSIALDRHGKIWAWGARQPNGSAQIAPVDPGRRRRAASDGQRSPAIVPEVDGIVAITATAETIAALGADGRLRLWGYYSVISCEQPLSEDLLANPRQIGAPEVVRIAAGDGFVVALKRDGSVWAVGLNRVHVGRRVRLGGILGPGREQEVEALQLYPVAGLPPATAVAAGAYQAAVITADDQAFAWGGARMLPAVH